MVLVLVLVLVLVVVFQSLEVVDQSVSPTALGVSQADKGHKTVLNDLDPLYEQETDHSHVRMSKICGLTCRIGR